MKHNVLLTCSMLSNTCIQLKKTTTQIYHFFKIARPCTLFFLAILTEVMFCDCLSYFLYVHFAHGHVLSIARNKRYLSHNGIKLQCPQIVLEQNKIISQKFKKCVNLKCSLQKYGSRIRPNKTLGLNFDVYCLIPNISFC